MAYEPAAEPDEAPAGISRSDMGARIRELIEPILIDRADDVLLEHPEPVEQAIYRAAGAKYKQPTFDDKITEQILSNQDLMKQIAEQRVRGLVRAGESEVEYVGRWLDLIFAAADRLNAGTWGNAARDLVQSGELSKTVDSLAGILSRSQVPKPGQPSVAPHTDSTRLNTVAAPDPATTNVQPLDFSQLRGKVTLPTEPTEPSAPPSRTQ